MSALLLVVIVAGAVSAACWIASLLTRDTSWVDRIWSVVPVVYVWIIAGASGFTDPRLLVMAVIVTLWGARLTFNFARKGGYSGVEDYRWAILRGRMKPWLFQVFNVLFIVLFQNALLVLITLPAYVALQHPAPLGAWDVTLAVLFLALLAGEFAADQQQWDFHQAKKRAGGDLPPGFATTGLFRFSRHPAFFFEQAQWWVFYAIGAVAAVTAGADLWGGALNASIAGAVLLTALFTGSTIFTESISAARHPAYRQYQRTTSMIVPLPPRRAPVSPGDRPTPADSTPRTATRM